MNVDINKKVAGIKLYELEKKPVEKLAAISKIAATDGAVLLKNEDNLLPLKKGTKVSVFGRIQSTYYKSGTGSGGMVNVNYVTNIIDSLRNDEDVVVNENLAKIYEDWTKEHPFYKGEGWASEPWCQEEMPLTDSIVDDANENSDVAIVVMGRTAGEDQDNSMTPGSVLLTELEEDMLKKVCSTFEKVVVLLNVGNIMEMSFEDRYKFNSLLYLWQAGQEGGVACVDILTGKASGILF